MLQWITSEQPTQNDGLIFDRYFPENIGVLFKITVHAETPEKRPDW